MLSFCLPKAVECCFVIPVIEQLFGIWGVLTALCKIRDWYTVAIMIVHLYKICSIILMMVKLCVWCSCGRGGVKIIFALYTYRSSAQYKVTSLQHVLYIRCCDDDLPQLQVYPAVMWWYLPPYYSHVLVTLQWISSPSQSVAVLERRKVKQHGGKLLCLGCMLSPLHWWLDWLEFLSLHTLYIRCLCMTN